MVISSLFYEKILQAQKSTKTHTTFLNMPRKTSKEEKVAYLYFYAFYLLQKTSMEKKVTSLYFLCVLFA